MHTPAPASWLNRVWWGKGRSGYKKMWCATVSPFLWVLWVQRPDWKPEQARGCSKINLIQKCLRTAENNPTSAPLPLMKPHSSSKAELSSSSCITREGSKNPEVSSFLESPAGSARQGQDSWVWGGDSIVSSGGWGRLAVVTFPSVLSPAFSFSPSSQCLPWWALLTLLSLRARQERTLGINRQGGKINKDYTVGEGQTGNDERRN